MLADGVVPRRTTGLPIADSVVVKVGFDLPRERGVGRGR